MQADDHSAIPMGIETVVSRLGELAVMFGPDATDAIASVRTRLIGAMAARDRGDGAGVVAGIGQAMDTLVELADRLDPAEAVLMRTVAEQFRAALLRRDTGRAREKADVMFDRAGAKWVKKSR